MRHSLARAWNGARFGLDIGRAALAGWAAGRAAGAGPPRPTPGAPLPVHVLLEGDPVRGLSPAARYRAVQYAPLLDERGFDCRLLPSRPGKYWSAGAGFQRLHRAAPRLAGLWALAQNARQTRSRRRDFRGLADGGVVWLQRDLQALAHSRLEQEIPHWNRHVVFDFDDAIWAQPPWVSADAALAAAQRDKLALLCQLATCVIAANDHLAAFARRHCARVTVVPTTLCTDEFAPAARRGERDDAPPVIGWAGTSGNLHYLRKLAPALRALRGRTPFVLRIVCNRVAADELGALRELPAGAVEFVEWNARDEVARLQQFDIGIMPLDDDDWARGKAGFKMLQYMACGVPFVASPVGANPVVGGGDGECGLYATSTDDWVDRLAALLAAPLRRQRLGDAGRARAVQRFDRRVHVDAIARVLREAVDA
ncbi:MAG: glycosyltransferase [Planctomycetota bacterium]